MLGIAAEIAPIEKRLKDSREITVQGYVFREGTLNGRRVVVGRSGAGKVNAAIITTLLIDQFKPSAILSQEPPELSIRLCALVMS